MSALGSARSEDDKWGATHGVGVTAAMVATSRALASRGPRALLDDRFAEPLVRAVGHEALTRMLDEDTVPSQDNSILSNQQRLELVAVRTGFFDKFLMDSAGTGIRQMVILAAGLDTRAYRLTWPASAAVFEIDQRQVIAFKVKTQSELRARPTVCLRQVGVDLRDDWSSALCAAGFKSDVPTAWIAEGLLMYLPPEAQDRLLAAVTELCAAGSTFATEHFPRNFSFADKHWQEYWDQRRRAGVDVEISDLMTDGQRVPAGDYLAANGWHTVNHSFETLYAANGFDYPGKDALAILGGMTYLSASKPDTSEHD